MIRRIISPGFIPSNKELKKPKIYRPDFSEDEKLFQVTGQHNIIDLMNANPKFQQAALSKMPVVDVDSFDTSGLSDSQMIDSFVERQFDVNEISEYAERDLNSLKDK